MGCQTSFISINGLWFLVYSILYIIAAVVVVLYILDSAAINVLRALISMLSAIIDVKHLKNTFFYHITLLLYIFFFLFVFEFGTAFCHIFCFKGLLAWYTVIVVYFLLSLSVIIFKFLVQKISIINILILCQIIFVTCLLL